MLVQITENVGDDHRKMVYADWLEEQGFLKRAEIVRLISALETGTDEDRLKVATTLSTKVEGESRTWLAMFAPSFALSTWATHDEHQSPYLIGFRTKYALTFRQHGNERTKGTWAQFGRAVVFDINKYAQHLCVLTADDRLVGVMRNGANQCWRARFERVAPEAIDAKEMIAIDPAMIDVSCSTLKVSRPTLKR